jgi:RND family efflux transporter MFP subunit
MKMLIGLLLTALMIITGSCSSHEEKTHTSEKAASEAIQVTAWSDKSELFMEYEPLKPGTKGSFLIHLTRMSDGKPVTEGALKLVLHPSSGQPLNLTVPAPVRPGIYLAELTVPQAGWYTLELLPEGKGFVDRLEVAGIQVGAEQPTSAGEKKDNHKGHDDHKEQAETKKRDDHDGHGHDKHTEDDHAVDQHTAEAVLVIGDGGGTITLLKEQQWALDVLVRQPEHKRLTGRISASGELMAAADGEATVAAPLAGVLSVTKPIPYLGKRVSKGEVIALIEPPIRPDGGAGQFSAVHAEARNRVTLASQEYERAKRLYESKIAPRKRVEEAAAALDSAKAALAPLNKSAATLSGDGSGRLAVRAPVSGTVVEVLSGTGKGIEAGQPIVRIVNTVTLWLKAHLPAVDVGKLPRYPEASFTVAGQDGIFKTGRLVSVGDMLDPQSRTLPVIFSVPNPDARLKVGMFATVAVSTGASIDGLVLPDDALAEDEGRFFVFIQTSGERFVRREVQIGVKDGGQVQIIKGLEDHERVVMKGAYYVKQASISAKKEDPHAGHAH